VFPSQTNFILARPAGFTAHEWQQKLRARKILVRWFNFPEVKKYLRITVGTREEAEALLVAVREIL
jgi:histidinol-phosphate aminotransferase